MPYKESQDKIKQEEALQKLREQYMDHDFIEGILREYE